MKKTMSLMAVLQALLDRPSAEHWGYDLQRQTGIRSGILYPILRRLLEAGWVEDGWEEPEAVEGRPPRRYYTLTDRGAASARTMLAGAEPERRYVLKPGEAST
jgi:PadR family transcriptional regulator, regulatory protein PadR